jgi:lysophospholipase L1-like esterase
VTLSFLALGDSYTIGEGVPAEDRWPVRLAERLRDDGIALADPHIVAQTGWTTLELLEAMGESGNLRRHDLVTLLAGVNDQYRGYGVDSYRESFDRLVQAAIAHAKLPNGLIVLSIPDWGATPYAHGRDRTAIAHEIDTFNSAAREIAMASGVRFLDITPLSRRAANDRSLLAADGLHPSRTMYESWVEALLPMARDYLVALKRT